MNAIRVSLASARVNAGLTQAELAKKLGVHKSTVLNWEKGKTSPNYHQMQEISALANIPMDYIFLPETLLKVDITKENSDKAS